MQLTAVFAQADKIYIDFNQINIGNDYSLLYYDISENELSEVVPSSNYVSSNQHIVTYNSCSTSTLGNSIEIISSNPDGIVCDNQQQTTFTVSSSLVDYEYQFNINGISIQGPSNLTTLTYTISSGSSVTVVAYPSVSNLCSQTQSVFQEYYELDNKYFYGALAFREQNFSLGIDLNSYRIQNFDLTSTQARLNFVYIIQINSTIYFLPSLSLGYNNVSLTVPNFIFEDQINQTTGFISSETSDPLGLLIGPSTIQNWGLLCLCIPTLFLWA